MEIHPKEIPERVLVATRREGLDEIDKGEDLLLFLSLRGNREEEEEEEI